MTPLLVHLMFHPRSAYARQVAHALHKALNGDHAIPHLAIPTRILVEDGTGLPPRDYDLDEVERSVAIVLADDYMAVDESVPSDRRSWGEFVAGIHAACQGKRHRFLPMQLSEHAWPLHRDLAGVSFARAFAQPIDEQMGFIERRIVVEICRFLLGLDPGKKLPVQIFISHAKQDIEAGPFKELIDHLGNDKPVESWIDSAKIEAGADFAAAIEDGVRDSAVLALLTEHYSGRTWCKREVLFAKRHRQPLVVADALNAIDVRSFPYLGNVPIVPWGLGGARRVVDVLLKEQLRHLHVRLLLKRASQTGDVILPTAPELSTISALPPNSTVLYPDPPLGDEETEVLKDVGHTIATPLQRASMQRELRGRHVALSISAPDSWVGAGLFPEHLDAALLEISRYLLVKGATLSYGGHLGPEGYTLKLFDLVLAHRNSSTLPPAEQIVNYVGWPQPLTVKHCAKYATQAKFVRIDRLPEFTSLELGAVPDGQRFEADTLDRRFAWSRGMTLMRERQTHDMAARIVLGGKVGATVAVNNGVREEKWYASRIPGVVEEALLALRAEKPLYVCGGFGGAAALIAALLRGEPVPKEFTWAYQKQAPHSEDLQRKYLSQGLEWLDYDAMARMFADIGVDGLSAMNHLSREQNLALFESRDVTRVIDLLLTGLTQ